MHPNGMHPNGRLGSVGTGPVENRVLPERHVLSDTGHTAPVHARRYHAGSAGRSGFSLSDEAIMQKTENRMSAVRFLPEPGGTGGSGGRQVFSSDRATVLWLNPERFRIMPADCACFDGEAGSHPSLRM